MYFSDFKNKRLKSLFLLLYVWAVKCFNIILNLYSFYLHFFLTIFMRSVFYILLIKIK